MKKNSEVSIRGCKKGQAMHKLAPNVVIYLSKALVGLYSQ